MSSIEVARQLIAAMRSDPEVAAEVRRAVLTDELLALPEQVRQLAEQVRQLAGQVRQLAEQVRQLAEAQARSEGAIAELAEAQARTAADVAVLKTDVAELKTDVAILKTDVAILKTDVAILKTDVGDLKGRLLAGRLDNLPRRYVPRRLAISVSAIAGERYDDLIGSLDESSASEVQRADALVDARLAATGEPVVLVVEAAWKAHLDDVERAERRAGLLRRVGVDTRALVVSQASPDSRVLAVAADRAVTVVSESGGLLVLGAA